MPANVLSDLHMGTHLIVTIIMWSMHYYMFNDKNNA